MIITDKERAMMERDVADAINADGIQVELRSLRPLDQQPNWNPKMREFVGDPIYDTVQITVDRYDRYITKSESNVAGDKIVGSTLIHVPIQYSDMINEDTIFVVDKTGIEWRVQSIKELLGELVINLTKMVGE